MIYGNHPKMDNLVLLDNTAHQYYQMLIDMLN